MKEKSCCFTGHRKIPKQFEKIIQDKLNVELESLIQSGVEIFYSGGALGFDTIAAHEILKLKKKYNNIKLNLVLPCKDQDKFWSLTDKAIYKYLLLRADSKIYTSEKYNAGCMHIRNRYMVEHSQYCIAYLTKEKGGTAYTVEYAKQNGLEIILLK